MIFIPAVLQLFEGPFSEVDEPVRFATPPTPGVYSGFVSNITELDAFMTLIGMTPNQWDTVWPAMGYADIAAIDTAMATGSGIAEQDIYDEFIIQFP